MHYSCMSDPTLIPEFTLFGETSGFPDVVHCERIRDRSLGLDWQISAHRHLDMVQLFHMEQGRAEVQVDGVPHQLSDGTFLYVPAQAVHGFVFGQGAEGQVLSMPLALLHSLPATTEEIGRRLAQPFGGKVTPRLAQALGLLASSFETAGIFRASLLTALAHSVLIMLAEDIGGPEGRSSSRHMGEFDRLLADKLSQRWGAAEFARALGITPGHLNRLCRAAGGRSASQHIEAKRMTEARRLLAFTQLSVAMIGYRLGYDDPPYFSRRFRQVTGQSPSDYRARFAG